MLEVIQTSIGEILAVCNAQRSQSTQVTNNLQTVVGQALSRSSFELERFQLAHIREVHEAHAGYVQSGGDDERSEGHFPRYRGKHDVVYDWGALAMRCVEHSIDGKLLQPTEIAKECQGCQFFATQGVFDGESRVSGTPGIIEY